MRRSQEPASASDDIAGPRLKESTPKISPSASVLRRWSYSALQLEHLSLDQTLSDELLAVEVDRFQFTNNVSGQLVDLCL